MKKADGYFFHGEKAAQILATNTVKALDIKPEDIIIIWRVAETLFACNPRLEDNSCVVLYYADIKAMINACFEDNSFHKTRVKLD